MTVSWSTLVYDTANRNELLARPVRDLPARRRRRGPAARAARRRSTSTNNWMHEFPTAYVIPVGAGQRSNAEANRLVEWLIFNGIQVTKLRNDAVVAGQNVERGSYVVPMNQAHRGLAETSLGIGVDISSRICDPLRAARGLEPRLPLGRRRDPGSERGGVHGPDDGADREADEVRRRRRVRRRPSTTRSRIDSATAVRTLNSLLDSGLTAKLALAQFTTPGGRTFPAGTVLFPFDPATKKTLGDAGRENGLLLRRVHARRSSWTTSTARRGSRSSRTRSTRASGRCGTSASPPTRSGRPRSTARDRIRSRTTT